MSKTTSIVIKIFVVLFGLAAIYYGMSMLQSNSSSWPSVKATVSSSQYSNSSSDYEVTYEYQVGADKYSGTFHNISKYQSGTEVTVYYDPKSPGSSVSSPGDAEMYGFIGILFGLFCVGGVGWEWIKPILANRQGKKTTD